MKQFLLFSLLFGLSMAVCAQDAGQILPGNSTDRTVGDRYETTVEMPGIGDFDKSVVADTLFPTIFESSCADTLQIFFADTTRFGFLNGTNNFFDLEKLQRITLEEQTNFSISEALVAFAVADSAIFDRNVFVNIFADDGGEDPLGDILGSSDTLTVREIAQGGFFSRFPFSTAVELTDASSFILGVNFADAYFNELDSVDYVGNLAIFSTDIGCGDGNNSFEIFPTANGLSYNTILGNWDVDLEFSVGVIVDRDPFTSTRTPLANYDATATPNPATNDLAITFNAPGNEQLTASLLTNDGRVVRSQSVRAGAGRVEWSVADLPAGLYLYQLTGSAGVQTGKVVVR